jgi:hypothetical protein
MSKNIDLLKGLFGEQVSELSEDQAAVISQKLDKLIETRVSTKVKFQTEVIEAEAKEKYDTLLKEATTKFNTALANVEKKTCTLAESFKSKMENKMKAFISESTKKQAADLEVIKEGMVEKLDKYLDLELGKKIPDTYVEAVAQVSVLQPIVEGFKKVMEENYIKFDEENFGLLKDARKEIISVRDELAKTVKENMEMNSLLKETKRSSKISKVCEGLTEAQRERASKLLESYDTDEIEERYNAIRDIIIENDSSKKEDEEKEEEKKEVKTEKKVVIGKKGEKGIKEEEKPAVPVDSVPVTNEKPDEEDKEEAAPVNEEAKLIQAMAQTYRSQVRGLAKR